jgi:hypothetical protein
MGFLEFLGRLLMPMGQPPVPARPHNETPVRNPTPNRQILDIAWRGNPPARL